MEKIKLEIKPQLSDLIKAAFSCVEVLQSKGFETYIAGGAVRDLYLNKEIHDIDIATEARPDEVKKIFPRSLDRGKAFGVVAVKVGKFEFEVATFRSDIGVADHRHPKKIEFTTAQNDAQRRDFTCNALFLDPQKKEVIDFVGGLKDLKAKVIRFVGNPEERIEEDYLRMLRAVRFAYRLNFCLEKEAQKAIHKNAEKISQISTERIRDELTAILVGPDRSKALLKLESLGLIKPILPEFSKLKGVKQPPEFHSEGDVLTHTLLALDSLVDPSSELSWTVLLHDIGKPDTQGFRDHPKSKITFFEHDVLSAKMAGEILSRLKFSHAFTDACVWAISQHMRIVSAFRGMSERKQKKLFTHPHIQLLLDLTRADLGASIRPNGQPAMEMYFEALKKKEQFEKETLADEKQQLKQFTLISGKDIMEILKISAGPKVGETKTKVEEAFLEGKISTRKQALEMIKGLKNE